MGWHIHAYHIYAHICAIHTIYGISIFIKITPQCANVADERTHENCIVNLIYLQAASVASTAAAAVLWLYCGYCILGMC